MIRQKSRSTWITLGDCNTVFHAHLKSRQAKNKVCSIYIKQRVKLTDPNMIQKEFLSFIQNLQGCAIINIPCLDITIARNGPCLTIHQQQLVQEVTKDDVVQALNTLSNDKSPGIDDFLAEFFKEYWTIMGDEVSNAVTQFFRNGKLLKVVNVFTMTLIPEVSKSTFVKNFRPISCCTTLYKLIAKI